MRQVGKPIRWPVDDAGVFLVDFWTVPYVVLSEWLICGLWFVDWWRGMHKSLGLGGRLLGGRLLGLDRIRNGTLTDSRYPGACKFPVSRLYFV